MLRRVKFEVRHVEGFRLRAEQADIPIDPFLWKSVENMRYQWTILRDDKPILCGGLVKQWAGRWQCWMMVSEQLSKREFVWIRREIDCIIFALDMSGLFRRIEGSVKADFEGAHKWARMFGAQAEGHMRKYDPLGNDHVLYARVM